MRSYFNMNLIWFVVSACNLLLFSDPHPHDLKKDDSHTCAVLLKFLVASEIV
jgi:hypothetical protein